MSMFQRLARCLTAVSSRLESAIELGLSGLSATLELGLGLWIWQGEELIERAAGPFRKLARWWHGTRAARALRAAKARLARRLERSRAGRLSLTMHEFCARHTPRWLYPVLVACALIPGPVDEGLVVIVVTVVLLGSKARRRELGWHLRAAWRPLAHRWPFEPETAGMPAWTVTLRLPEEWLHVHLGAADADDALRRALASDVVPGKAESLRVQPRDRTISPV